MERIFSNIWLDCTHTYKFVLDWRFHGGYFGKNCPRVEWNSKTKHRKKLVYCWVEKLKLFKDRIRKSCVSCWLTEKRIQNMNNNISLNIQLFDRNIAGSIGKNYESMDQTKWKQSIYKGEQNSFSLKYFFFWYLLRGVCQ